MNKILLAILLLSASFTVQSSSDEHCKFLNKSAKTIMEARQAGMPLIDVLPPKSDEPIMKMMRVLALDAFEQPLFSTEKHKAKAISEFQSKWFLSCLKETGEL